MENRRSFLKKSAMLSGVGGVLGSLPASIQRAFAIDPAPGTTYLDAEHVVILMQENRSFDHCYGSLQGVRGFNDPRAIQLPNQNPVWLQSNSHGETYAPFRLDLNKTKATWMGSLPHSWANQVDALNQGKHDGWLEAKRSGHKDYADMPLTLGYHTREDLPFYYALADAFTICDQHFCSSLTGTMPNRLYLWSGTVRGVRDASAPAKVLNENVEYENSASWITFPERLEQLGMSWKVYQNELSLDVGFTTEEGAWLANFGDNPLEWFTQYHVRFSPAYRAYLDRLLVSLPGEIQSLKARLQSLASSDPGAPSLRRELEKAETVLRAVGEQREKYSEENFEKLSATEKNLHRKAFATNTGDPAQRELALLRYSDGGVERELKFPKGDVLHQFRQDVETGKLPAVSWIVAPENFSDHPSSAWFGAWYLSEVMDILTRNPEVWKKTLFILTYDENDGYFDHVPPFVAPHPHKPATGSVSRGMNVEEDFVTLEEDLRSKKPKDARESSIGLGFRVPMVIASPWSRGGYVCSQVFDHTSVLQLLERFVSHKTDTKVVEKNISDWRRAVCGDLSSVFRPFNGEPIPLPKPVDKIPFVEGIHRAKFLNPPVIPRPLAQEEVEKIQVEGRASARLPRQEPGVRPSCPLPYELYADGRIDKMGRHLEIRFASGNQTFGARSAGSPFSVRAPGIYAAEAAAAQWGAKPERGRHWAFAVAPGSALQREWPLTSFENHAYHLRVDGPNGFFREFRGSASDPRVEIRCDYQRNGRDLTGSLEMHLENKDRNQSIQVQIDDLAYGTAKRTQALAPGARATLVLDLQSTSGWYDFQISLAESKSYAWRYAGRVETGKAATTDPAMGRG